MYKNSNNNSDILVEINVKREMMIQCANQYGFTNEKTIQHSQELDELINEYQKNCQQSVKSVEEIKFAFKHMTMIWPKVLLEI